MFFLATFPIIGSFQKQWPKVHFCRYFWKKSIIFETDRSTFPKNFGPKQAEKSSYRTESYEPYLGTVRPIVYDKSMSLPQQDFLGFSRIFCDFSGFFRIFQYFLGFLGCSRIFEDFLELSDTFIIKNKQRFFFRKCSQLQKTHDTRYSNCRFFSPSLFLKLSGKMLKIFHCSWPL